MTKEPKIPFKESVCSLGFIGALFLVPLVLFVLLDKYFKKDEKKK